MVFVYILMAIMLILGLFLFYLAFKVIKLVFKIFLIAVAVIMILFVVFSVLVVSDINDITSNLKTNTSITLIEKDSQYVKGFIYNPGGDIDRIENVTIYNNMTNDEIVEGHYKLIIMHPSDIENEEYLEIYEKPVALFRAYKDGDTSIYPELKTTRFIKKMPTWMIEKILDRE